MGLKFNALAILCFITLCADTSILQLFGSIVQKCIHYLETLVKIETEIKASNLALSTKNERKMNELAKLATFLSVLPLIITKSKRLVKARSHAAGMQLNRKRVIYYNQRERSFPFHLLPWANMNGCFNFCK